MTVEVPRVQAGPNKGKPLVIPPGGGKPVAYSRASSFGDVLDDRSNLEKWKLRKVARGLATRPDLQMAVATTPETEKGALNRLVDQAFEAAGGSNRATTGTSLHTLTELLDRGEPLPPYPAEYVADIEAYRRETEAFDHHLIEEFVVNDELQVAGTPDRVSLLVEELLFDGGVTVDGLVISDLKTGSSGGQWLGKHAVQLAIYSRSQLYDPATGERTPISDIAQVNQRYGVIFHAPAGEGRCDLYALDLEQGWAGALLAADVRAWRKRKGLARPTIEQQEAAA